MHPYQRNIDLCNAVLTQLRASIPADLFRDVYDYINRFDEWGLGVEILVDQLSELDIPITRANLALVEEVIRSMGLDMDGVEYLRKHGVVEDRIPDIDD